MNKYIRCPIIIGLLTLPFAAVANYAQPKTQSMFSNINGPSQLSQQQYARSRCVRWRYRCYRVRRCANWGPSGRYSRCFYCYRYTRYWRGVYHAQRRYYSVRTCNFNRMRHLRHLGYQCRYNYRSFHGNSRYCYRWYTHRYCRNVCVKRASY